MSGDQAGADLERVEEAKKRLDLVHVVLDPGDTLFFHPNLLHSSAANNSENSRWAMICCYNAAANDPYKDSHHPRYTKLHKVEDEKVLEVGYANTTDSGVSFADLEAEDESAQSLE